MKSLAGPPYIKLNKIQTAPQSPVSEPEHGEREHHMTPDEAIGNVYP